MAIVFLGVNCARFSLKECKSLSACSFNPSLKNELRVFHLVSLKMEKSCTAHFKPVFSDFFSRLSDELHINPDELAHLKPADSKCLHKIARGENAGRYCKNNALANGFCGSHQNRATEGRAAHLPKVAAPKAGPTKTQLQIIEWLNTAVQQSETVLHKRSKGLVHEDTEFIFSDDFIVIGKIGARGAIEKLSRFDVSICEKNGWGYSEVACVNDAEDSKSILEDE